jgi:hypothetical protein
MKPSNESEPRHLSYRDGKEDHVKLTMAVRVVAAVASVLLCAWSLYLLISIPRNSLGGIYEWLPVTLISVAGTLLCLLIALGVIRKRSGRL